MSVESIIDRVIYDHTAAIAALEDENVGKIAEILLDAFANGRKVLICGCGGSAADAQHFASELVGRFINSDRRALSVISLATDVAALTAIGNDYGFDRIFDRQINAHARRGDVLIAISTSGRSKSVIQAIAAARAYDMRIIGLTGDAPSYDFCAHCEVILRVKSTVTARIQEVHHLALHIVCEIIEEALCTRT